MKEGSIVTSLKGHDRGRSYLVLSAVGEDFVLLADGKYRKLDKPKLKRVKHVKFEREAEIKAPLTDKKIRELCK